MPKRWSEELDTVNFRCQVCRYTWEEKPDLVEPDEAPEAAHHPWRYFATCPVCKASNQPQAPWERALLKAHQTSTGPRTPEGQKATTANLAGHPTPEEALRTRFNAMKHGLNARVANYFPAKPDGYAFCKRCDVDRYWCAEQPACVKQTETFMLHSVAFEQRNPRALAKIHGDLHAALVASLQMCLQAVLGDGVVIKTPKLEMVPDADGVLRNEAVSYFDAAGQVHYIYDYMANPAFKPIADLITRLGLSLSDLGMTIKAQDEEEGALRGRLGGNDERVVEETSDFSQRMARTFEQLPAVLAAAHAAAAKDPVLLEHEAQTGAATKAGGSKVAVKR